VSRLADIAGRAAAAIEAASLLLFPLAVLAGVAWLGPRLTALALLALVLPGALRGRSGQRAPVPLPGPLLAAGLAALLLAAALLDDARFLLAYPVLVNALFLAQFGGSLLAGPPLVERLARVQVRDLSAAEVRYCRAVTVAWSAFFALNGAAAAALAAFAPRAWWALYTGAIAYGLVALLFSAEYAVRKARFGRYGKGPVDRALASLFKNAAAG
jgi:uncharacterized membrane protein